MENASLAPSGIRSLECSSISNGSGLPKNLSAFRYEGSLVRLLRRSCAKPALPEHVLAWVMEFAQRTTTPSKCCARQGNAELTPACGERRLDDVVRHRRGTRLRQWLALLLLVTVGGLPVVSLHSAEDDPACTGERLGSAGEQAVGPAAAAPRHEHCAVCHAMRAFRIAPKATRQPGIAVARVSAPEPERGRLHRVPTDNRRPTRAPPLSQF